LAKKIKHPELRIRLESLPQMHADKRRFENICSENKMPAYPVCSNFFKILIHAFPVRKKQDIIFLREPDKQNKIKDVISKLSDTGIDPE
jgi:hypothetical protein